jgi:hypothetical protein
MKRLITILTATAFLMAIAATPASAEFGFKETAITFTGPSGGLTTQAGSHPFAMATTIEVNTAPFQGGPNEAPDGGAVEDLRIGLPVGFAGDPGAVPFCPAADFLQRDLGHTACRDATALGISAVEIATADSVPPEGIPFLHVPVYNLAPPPGKAARLGFSVLNVAVFVDIGLNASYPYNVEAHANNIPQAAVYYGSVLSLWGDPGSPAHDEFRGHCLQPTIGSDADEPISVGECPLEPGERRAYLTVPRSCSGPLESSFETLSWLGKTDSTLSLTEPGMVGCSKLEFAPRFAAKPTTDSAESPSGLDVSLEIDDEGLTNPKEGATAQSDLKQAVVTLPEGVTANPSVAEGLATCSPSDLERETLTSEPGEGCPRASKIGSVEVESPLLEGELIRGSLFIAQQDDPSTATPGQENPFDTLLALYVVIKHAKQGILVKLAGKVEPDPETGQLTTTFGDPSSADPAYRQLPQLPFSDFRLRFREGGRSPLISPPACATYTTVAKLTPWANPNNPLTTTSSFQVTSGVAGGPCPPGGIPPFAPEFTAGSIDNNANSFSPFYMRLIRHDGEQDMTKFSSVLPPGVVGKLAGVGKCSDAQIAAAKAKTGRQELASPSCPANSKIGRTLAGAGVGSQLTYVPGQIYLAGPYNGAPLSVVAITSAVAGPFDAGVVVVREALTIDPLTAEVMVDGEASDPIPHILQGIPLKVRDLRVYVDRENFILNPTSCDPSKAKATLFGSFLDVFSPADDVPVDLATRYQAANCANLGFKPRLALSLRGGTKRGGHPALRGVFRPRPGDANLSHMVLRLPRSAFLDQSHIRTICTRVQFAAKSCPPGAIYGKATAWSPLLDEPLTGPVYLRSSSNKLPDFVAHLHGLVDVEAVARIDSAGGGIRATFPIVPDAPLTKVVVEMQGGDKGLIVNSRNLCAGRSKADALMSGHNGKRYKSRPQVKALGCGRR